MIKRIYGTSEEILLEILLNLGQASASNVIFQSANRLKEANGSRACINTNHYSLILDSLQMTVNFQTLPLSTKVFSSLPKIISSLGVQS